MSDESYHLSELPQPIEPMKNQRVLFFVAMMLLLAMLACVTLRSPDAPPPTRRPTLAPTATLTATPKPFPLGG